MIEVAFSVVKRVVGEYVVAKFVNMVKEMMIKVSIYDGFIKAMV